MRGSPLLRACVAFLVILSLGYPLWRMTRESATAEAPVAAPAAVIAIEVRLRLTFTAPPTAVKVRHLGKVILDEPAPTISMERTLPLAYPAEGVELHFEVEWPPETPLAAARVQLTDPAGTEHEQSIWGRGAADEVLTFP